MTQGKAYTNRKPVEQRPEADFYETPYSLTWKLLERNEFPIGVDIYEPAAGNGAIASQLIKAGFSVTTDDILVTGKDFLAWNGRCKYIITNPPFSLFDGFVMRAKQCSDKFAFIMKTNFLGAHSRTKTGVWKNLKRLYVFDRQIDYRTPILESGELCIGNLITGWGIWDMSWKEDYFETRILDVQKYCTLGSYDSYMKKEAQNG